MGSVRKQSKVKLENYNLTNYNVDNGKTDATRELAEKENLHVGVDQGRSVLLFYDKNTFSGSDVICKPKLYFAFVNSNSKKTR